MSENRFTDGNLIVMYAIRKNRSTDETLPDYLKERIKICLDTFRIIMQSKADKHKTFIMVVGNGKSVQTVREELVKQGIDERIIAIDSSSETVAQTFDNILKVINTRLNPPHIYFIAPVWLKDVYDSIVSSKLKGYKVQFEGVLDNRPVNEVENEKALEAPKKGVEHYKRKAKNKAIDMLLNYIFPEEK
jgi:hypothetical protein